MKIIFETTDGRSLFESSIAVIPVPQLNETFTWDGGVFWVKKISRHYVTNKHGETYLESVTVKAERS